MTHHHFRGLTEKVAVAPPVWGAWIEICLLMGPPVKQKIPLPQRFAAGRGIILCPNYLFAHWWYRYRSVTISCRVIGLVQA